MTNKETNECVDAIIEVLKEGAQPWRKLASDLSLAEAGYMAAKLQLIENILSKSQSTEPKVNDE